MICDDKKVIKVKIPRFFIIIINILSIYSITIIFEANSKMIHQKHPIILLIFQLLFFHSSSFTLMTKVTKTNNIPHHITTTSLHAKNNSNKKRATRNTIGNRTQSTSGFGGASILPCPCGSDYGYMKCCGLIHNNAKVYGDATAEQVVRARYSAYAKRQVCVYNIKNQDERLDVLYT